MTWANPSVGNRLCSTPQKRCEYVLKTSWKLVNKNSITWWYVLKASWKRSGFLRLQDAFKTSSRRLQEVLQKCLQDIFKTSWRRLQNVSKASWRCLENVLKASWRCLEEVFARRFQDILRTFWRRLSKTSWKRIEDVSAQVFSCEFCEMSKNTFFYRTPLVAAFVLLRMTSESLKKYFSW